MTDEVVGVRLRADGRAGMLPVIGPTAQVIDARLRERLASADSLRALDQAGLTSPIGG